jgi:AraC-like DNA-binding protein/mannose-6-phosphate isomerase-like protein (cupin superfamily)
MTFPIYAYKEFMPEEDFPFKIEVRSSENFNSVLHAHEHLQLCYMVQGTCTHRIGNKEAVIVPGDFFSVPPFLEHQIMWNGPDSFHMHQIDFMPHLINENMRDLSKLDDFIDFAYIQPLVEGEHSLLPKLNFNPKDKLVVESLIASMFGEVREQRDGYKLAVKADLLKLLVISGRAFKEYQRSNNSSSKALSAYRQSFYEAITHLEQHHAEDLRLEDYAKMAYMSPNYFSSTFKLIMGVGFSEFVNRLRIQKAIELLNGSERSITEIIYKVGFNSVGHFNKSFKKATGVTPSEFRRGK